MQIDKDHLYYGAAAIQIAEHPSFTAINAFKVNNRPMRCAYVVNQDLGVYMKYRTEIDRKANWVGGKVANEYMFVFNDENLEALKKLDKKSAKAFLAFVCVADKHICCITYQEFSELIARRRTAFGGIESQYTLVVAFMPGGRFRVYVTPPKTRNKVLGDALIIPRAAFPSRIFE